MIHTFVANWHKHLRGEFAGGLDELLHDDVVFYSPVVYTPQVGKAITKLYLQAAGGTLNEPEDGDAESSSAGLESMEKQGSFRYIKEVADGNTVLFEFETKIDGKYVNGIDLITIDDDGKIIEIKVMIRPLQAVNAIHQAMGAMLEKMAG